MILIILTKLIIHFIESVLKLENRFSVGLQTLPINTDPFTINKSARFYNKILDVKRLSDVLRNSSDYFVSESKYISRT